MYRSSSVWLALLSLYTATACGGGHVSLPSLGLTAADTTELLARGRYIVRNVAVCGQCHGADPKNPDGPLSGGLAFKNWRIGTVRAANLTPDDSTGIGQWSEAEIVRAIRNGEDRDGHLLAPVMPYEWFSGMSDRDALAVAHYLKSQAPIRNRVRSQHSLAYKFARIFFLRVKKTRPEPAPERAPDAAYGKYLVHHVALCADCHTPRGGLQQKAQLDKLLSGNDDPPGDFPANPLNLTPDRETGIGDWSEADFVRTIRTGVDPDDHELNPFMPYKSFARMSDDDLRAIYAYLRAIPPIRHVVPHRHH